MIARNRHAVIAMAAAAFAGALSPMRVVEAVEATARTVKATRSRTPNPVPHVNDPKLAKYLRTSKIYKRGGGAKGK